MRIFRDIATQREKKAYDDNDADREDEAWSKIERWKFNTKHTIKRKVKQKQKQTNTKMKEHVIIKTRNIHDKCWKTDNKMRRRDRWNNWPKTKKKSKNKRGSRFKKKRRGSWGGECCSSNRSGKNREIKKMLKKEGCKRGYIYQMQSGNLPPHCCCGERITVVEVEGLTWKHSIRKGL